MVVTLPSFICRAIRFLPRLAVRMPARGIGDGQVQVVKLVRFLSVALLSSLEQSRSAMMEKEYPKKVSRVGLAHQVRGELHVVVLMSEEHLG